MDLEEFKLKKEEMLKRHDNELAVLQKEYAFSNNTVKVGDILEILATPTIRKLVKVLKVQYCKQVGLNQPPCCVYVCELLKMNGTPRKKPETHSYYQAHTLFKVRKEL